MLLAVATCLPTTVAEGVPVRLPSDKNTLWLISHDADADLTRIAGRRKGEWMLMTTKSSGAVVAACATEGDLHVFFGSGSQGAHWLWRLDPKTRLPGSWPEGVTRTALAACAGRETDGVRPIYLMLRSAPAAGRATSGPTSRPTAPAGGVALAIFRGLGDRWTLLTVAPAGVLPPGDFACYMADTDKGLVALVCTADGWPVWLGRFADGQWHTDTPLPALKPNVHRIVSLAVAKRRLWLLGTTAKGDEERTVWLRRLDPVTGELAGPGDIKHDGETLTLAAGESVAAAAFGEELAVTWGRGDKWTLASLSFSGDANTLPDGEYDFAGEGEQPYEKVLEWLPLALTALLLVGLLWRRGKQQTAPFILPPQLVPSIWPKRILAFVVDFLPFWFMAGSAFGLMSLGRDEVQRMLDRAAEGKLPDEVLIAFAWTGAMYLAYAIITESLFGATVGKALFRMRVIATGGRRASFGEIALRNLSKLPELIPPMLLLFVLWPFFTRFRQRCGDIIANTTVVDRRTRMVILSEPPPGQPSEPPPEQGDAAEPPAPPPPLPGADEDEPPPNDQR